MSPSAAALCFVKLEEALKVAFPEDWKEGLDLSFHVRDLELATTIEAEDGERQPSVYRRFKSMSKADAQFVVGVRNAEPFCNLSLEEERAFYRSFRKLCQL